MAAAIVLPWHLSIMDDPHISGWGGALGASLGSMTLIAGFAADDLPPELQMTLTDSSLVEPHTQRSAFSYQHTPLDPPIHPVAGPQLTVIWRDHYLVPLQ